MKTEIAITIASAAMIMLAAFGIMASQAEATCISCQGVCNETLRCADSTNCGCAQRPGQPYGRCRPY
jgi:hypothetical protein